MVIPEPAVMLPTSGSPENNTAAPNEAPLIPVMVTDGLA